MLKGLISKVVGDPNEREINKLQPLVEAINALEPQIERQTQAELRARTDEFRARLTSGETLDELLVEAFATVREVAKRTVDMRPFDVQLIGGVVLHRGMVAEMRTGEGKTLVATMPVYLNALLGKGVHLVTVNDYLARRDALWMGPIYHTLGLSVGLLQSGAEQPAYLYDPDYERDPYPGLRAVPRKEAYAADVTYGTNNEFGFDYLRDNIALSLDRRVQRPLYYAIVDEVDNIFIDEARTPLIISGPSDEPVEEYGTFATIARQLEPEVHYELDDKERSVYLTDEGLAVVERETGIENIYDEANYRYVHYMQQALKAQVLFQAGRDYIRQRKEIVLIDQHTGRLMPSRRLSEGLHQAIEAKEGVPVQPRDVTSATITIQNYFRMYEKLAGMSGTAVTEAEEFFKIYELDVLAIPTNEPVIREDHADVVYRTEEAKFRAVAREILACHSRGQPVLVGTTSVEKSEQLSNRLTGERLQMAALAPRIAYALQDAELDRKARDAQRETLNGSLGTMNVGAWKRVMRDLGISANMLSDDNLAWIASYLELDGDGAVQRRLERALREGIDHDVLNAKEHTREATIIARAGEPGAVTIATNMAGRGVDIKLGGELSDETIRKAHQAMRRRGIDPFRATPDQMDSAIAEVVPQYAKRREQVLDAGGLHVLGTERHEARRIDNQLRGRSGRQGEPGSSRFYLSLEDDLMRRFGRREMLNKLMETIGDDFPIEHGLVSRTIERAQTSVEGYNFDIRKHLLEYDDVLNRQRETIYAERLHILKSDDLRAEVWRMLEGQVDEYLERTEEDADRQRLLFAGLDDVVPLILLPPKSPFQGPLTFGGPALASSRSGLTAFPPFTISFLADQLAGQPLDQVRQTLHALSRQAAAAYGAQVRQNVRDVAQDVLDKYDERLERYQALLDEKIGELLMLAEERNEPVDPRRLIQYLERTYPLKLSTPPELYNASLDEMQDHWLAEIEVEFHQQVCLGVISRAQLRLPADASLDRLRPLEIPPDRLRDEVRRVRDLAAEEPAGDGGRPLASTSLPDAPGPRQVLDFVAAVKEASDLDYGRLDRLVGHVLGAHLDELIADYQQVVEPDDTRLQRDLGRLRKGVSEGRRGAGPLVAILEELNGLVHLEIADLEELLGLAVGHEYDKWAQRQLSELNADVRRSPLADTSWEAIAGHLLATHYTQRQSYDREHRRRATWTPRLSFAYLGQAYVQGMAPEALRTAILDSLRRAMEQREEIWGEQEFQRWAQTSLDELDLEIYDGLLRFLGERALGADRDRRAEDLPADLYEYLRFTLKLRELEDERLANLPHSAALLARLAEALQDHLLDTPVRELDEALQERVEDQLRRSGFLDDPEARQRLVALPIRSWDGDTRDEVAAFWGRRFVETHQNEPVAELEAEARETVVDYLQQQRRFVDERQVQHFLVHQRLSDLPAETRRDALHYLARTRLEHVSRRKIANLDVSTRQAVVDSLQRMGLFTDQARREAFQSQSLDGASGSEPGAGLPEEVSRGFRRFLARRRLDGHRQVEDLDVSLRQAVVERLKSRDQLADPERLAALPEQRLPQVDPAVAVVVEEELAVRLREDLAAKTMEELPAETRREVRLALEEQNYFVDPEKVGWYERKTLAQLPSDVMQGLEVHLGRLRLAELADIAFQDLPNETQAMLEGIFDSEGVLTKRAERLRLTQTGSLADLPDSNREAVAHQLGRKWLVRVRNRRPPDLPEREREIIWSYLRAQGRFTDEFKEELFQYQRLDEFDAETQQAVKEALVERLARRLENQPIGELPAETRDVIRRHLRQADYFVDSDRLRRAVGTPVDELPEELQQAVEVALGGTLLDGMETTPVAELPGEIRDALWQYLAEIGYFVDEKKRSQMLERRLVDLKGEQFEQVVQDLVRYLEGEIGDEPISDLDEELRQGLRDAVEALGYFESDEERARLLGQPLGALRRADLEALTVELGQSRLDAARNQSLADLPTEDRDAVVDHLQAVGWFVDPGRVNSLQYQRLQELDAEVRDPVVQTLREQHAERLRRQRLSALSREQRRIAQSVLHEQGLALDEGKMRPYRSQRLGDLDRDVYRALLHDLGTEAIADWPAARFQDLDEARRNILSAFLGRRIMARIERRVLLHTISRLWIDYLTQIEDLRRGIGLEAYGQRDPLVEYKRRAFELFEDLGKNIRRDVTRSLFRQLPQPLDDS